MYVRTSCAVRKFQFYLSMRINHNMFLQNVHNKEDFTAIHIFILFYYRYS